MNEDQGFSSLLKIVIITILLSLVLVTILIYSKDLNKNLILNQKSKSDQVQVESQQKIIVNYDELVKNYKQNLLEVIIAFDGNYQDLQDKIVGITVPSGFQELHLQLVLALNPALYEENEILTKQRLQGISNNNDWLQSSLEENILNN